MNVDDEYDEELANMIAELNEANTGRRRGTDHIKSATMGFGDPACKACQQSQAQGGCEAHRLPKVPEGMTAAPALPFTKAKGKTLYFDPKDIDEAPIDLEDDIGSMTPTAPPAKWKRGRKST